MGTYAPSLSQAALLTFEQNFYDLAQQKNTLLGSSAAIQYLASKGKTHNLPRIGGLELSETSGRNPLVAPSDYSVDNRQLTKRRFTKSILIDKKHDINELISDPTSALVNQLVYAKNRVIDRVIAAAAVGTVTVGDPGATGTAISAATDGVLTVDASAGLTYAKIQEITQNFVNNNIPYSEFMGSQICVTGKENKTLMGLTEFTNNDYISNRPVDKGVMDRLGTYGVQLFAGSVSGGSTVVNPILVEGVTYRSCLVLAPKSIALSMEIGRLDVVEAKETYVDSYLITVDLWINAMRIEGSKVQELKTTI